MSAWIRESLPAYYVVGVPRSETLEDEQAAIAFQKDRFYLVHMDAFWLSKTPYLPGSRYAEQSICPRVATEVVL